MVFIRASFVLLAATLTALAGPLQPRDLATLEQDVSTISADLATVNADLGNLDSAGAAGLTPLAADTQTLISDVQKATGDINANGPLSESDSADLTPGVTTAGENLIGVLSSFVAEHGTFEQLSTEVPGLIQETEQSIEGFAETVADFTEALGKISPPDAVTQGAALSSSIVAAFETAIAAYAN